MAAIFRSLACVINLGCLGTLMPQHLLDVSQIDLRFKQVGGEGVAQGVNRNVFPDPCLLACLLQDLLQCPLVRQSGSSLAIRH